MQQGIGWKNDMLYQCQFDSGILTVLPPSEWFSSRGGDGFIAISGGWTTTHAHSDPQVQLPPWGLLLAFYSNGHGTDRRMDGRIATLPLTVGEGIIIHLCSLLLLLRNYHQLRIEVSSTAFQTDTITLILTLTFNLMRATVMTHSHAEGQGQRSLGSRTEIDGQRHYLQS